MCAAIANRTAPDYDPTAMSTIRRARLQDARTIARIEVETWRTTYAGMLPDRVLLRMSTERQAGSWAGFLRQRPGDVLVAQQAQPTGDIVVGFGNCGPQRDALLGYAGEVYTLYIAPEAQGRGFGRLLLLGWSFSLFFHLANGIRHLFWDAGYGFSLKTTYASGWTAVVAAGVLTVLVWGVGLAMLGG